MNKTASWFVVCAGSALATVVVGRSLAGAGSEVGVPVYAAGGAESSPLAPAQRTRRPQRSVPAWAEMIGNEVDAATGLPRFVRDKKSHIELVLIPPGRFQRGDSLGRGNHDERPVHEVVITSAFYLGRYEVTRAEWQQAVAGNPAMKADPSRSRGDLRQPVENVTWADVQGFLHEVGMRLPTEAEWEYAARAGDVGDGPANPQGWFNENCTGPKPVDLKRDGANPWGLVGMFGNVREWCADRYDPKYYFECAQLSPLGDPAGPIEGDHRVVRGNGFDDNGAHCRYGDRWSLHERADNPHVGFRVARNP
ncbi:MAG: formylglycine-generating enzyme family protein [Planctomycetes bacterium]|nr:formylglycine-generating enzyme family protein [Planctomycetota bacterium]